MSEFRGAVIGVGGIGKRHAQMQRDTGRIEVVGLCDANPDLAEWAAEAYPEAGFYTELEQMLSDAKPDLVSVVTPHDQHAPLAQACLRAGAHVITEKPMATRIEDVEAMLATARAQDRFVTVFHNRRLDPWLLAAREAVQQGLMGSLVELSTGMRYAPSPKTWRGWTEPSGGLTFDWGAHLVDYMLQLHGGRVKTVAGFQYRGAEHEAGHTEDHATIDIRFEDGAQARVLVSALLCGAAPERLRLIGEKGTLVDRWSDGEEACFVHRLDQGYETQMRIPYRKRSWQEVYDNLAAAMAGESALWVSGESAADVVRVLCTAVRSHEQGGTPVALR